MFKKKRFYIIICILTITLIIINNQYKTIEAISIPIFNHTVIIDAGHGLPDGGAIANDGTSEEKINLSIALKLKKRLEKSGCTVILTRSDENGIYNPDATNKKKSDLENRVKLANQSNGDIFVSIHLNKISISNCSGWQTFYQKNNDNSKLLSHYIQNDINKIINLYNKRTILPLSGKYIMDNINIPTVIVECGFLSNLQELSNLKNPEYQEKLAIGIYMGIVDYFSNNMI